MQVNEAWNSQVNTVLQISKGIFIRLWKVQKYFEIEPIKELILTCSVYWISALLGFSLRDYLSEGAVIYCVTYKIVKLMYRYTFV